MTGQEKIELMERLGCPCPGPVVGLNEMVLCEEINRLQEIVKNFNKPNKVESDTNALESGPATKCKFDKAWIGKCGKSADQTGFCEEHRKEKCVSCGKQATHTCDETGQFVCGAPLCDDCTHNTHPEGHNGGVGFNALPWPKGMKIHCKKSDVGLVPPGE